jgi:hypothetical protein
LGDRLDQLRFELFGKTRGRERREAEGSGRKRQAEFEIAVFEYNMSKQQSP